jgi:iron complex outermembrane recepter protein
MLTKLKIILLTCVLAYSATAQQTAKITGTVTDGTGKFLSSVTVGLLKAKDSSLIKAAATSTNGTYEFIEAVDSFLLSYSSAGFATQYSAIYKAAASTTPLPTVMLVPTEKKLQGVTVVSKKPMIEVKADKTVFNVEASINATGSNALELLQKSPGVLVDNNDNISMKGKTGVRVYIDGKMTQLDTKDLAAYLKSINSNDIEAIEMISNPSAKYDASGNAGIINIRLKKNKKFGTNGSVNVGLVQGVTPKANGSVNLNYRNKKVNVFGNAGQNVGQYRNFVRW